MKKSFQVLAAIVILVSLLQFCTRKKVAQISDDPILTIGHGSILSKDGNEIKVTETFIKQVQELYIRRLTEAGLEAREGGKFDQQRISRIKESIYKTVDNSILANALFIEWLIEQRKPKNEAQFSTVNNALRWYYVLKIQKNPILPDKNKRWSKGIPYDRADRLEKDSIIVYSITNSGMQAYCQECLEAGVPVPPNMFGPEWIRLGAFDNEFISGSNQAELMIYVSNEPEGFCLALPRYSVSGTTVGDDALLFGVICLGTRTSKACFFDNPNGTFFRRDQQIDFRTNFLGGNDLILNAQGTCTDCHAGENPYVIHPEKQPFEDIYNHVASTLPARWHDPIVPGTWPQNPGPTNILLGINSSGQCSGCHMQGSAGRFPDLSFPLPGYCNSVLSKAVRPVASGGTMPPFGMNRSQFQAHIDALTAFCSLTGDDGKFETGTLPPDNSFISSPLVLGPIYTCATTVAVRGAVLDAKVSLLINGAVVKTISPARNPFQIDFSGLTALRAGDVVTATQEQGGAVSPTSAPVTVKNYQEDYPAGLPKPFIDPTTVFECASLIAVRHVPGATLTVFNNGGNQRTYIGGGTGWTSIAPAGPFSLNDEFTVKQSLCTDNSSLSDPVRARAAPSSLGTPAFNPATIFNGQELVNVENFEYGAKVTLQIPSAPWTGTFSTPITWYSNYDVKSSLGRPLRSGDDLQAMQSLCNRNSSWSPVSKLHDCERLPGPQIERPIAGNNFVVIASAVPGARIMIYDSGGVEIGDGSAPIIVLRRALIGGEVLRVVQRVGECTSRFIYQVRVSGGKK
jgi:hypothetical protein